MTISPLTKDELDAQENFLLCEVASPEAMTIDTLDGYGINNKSDRLPSVAHALSVLMIRLGSKSNTGECRGQHVSAEICQGLPPRIQACAWRNSCTKNGCNSDWTGVDSYKK